MMWNNVTAQIRAEIYLLESQGLFLEEQKERGKNKQTIPPQKNPKKQRTKKQNTPTNKTLEKQITDDI